MRALPTGELPEHIDPDRWQGWLDVSRQSIRLTPLVAALFALVAVGQGVAHAWAFASFVSLLVVSFLVSWWVQRKRITRLAAAVERHAAESPTA